MVPGKPPIAIIFAALATFASAVIEPEGLAEWAAGVGISVSDRVKCSHFHATTTQEVKAGGILATLPARLAFRSSALPDTDPSLARLRELAGVEKVDDRVRLVLQLMAEQAARASQWSGYLRSLPTTLAVPLLFNEADTALLEKHDAHARIVQLQRSVGDSWAEFIRHVAPATATQQSFLQLFAIVSGWRTILQMSDSDPGFLGLLPILSAATHSASPNCEIRFGVSMEEAGGETDTQVLFQQGKGAFTLTALQDIPQGSVLTANYGFASNLESFSAQGVVEERDDLDSLTLVTQAPDEQLAPKLEKAGVVQQEFILTPQSVPVSLLQYLRVKHGANVDNPTVLERVKAGKGVSVENDRLALGELLRSITAASGQFSSTVEEDTAQLLSRTLSPSQARAVQYRRREKLVLRGVVKLIKEVWAVWLLSDTVYQEATAGQPSH